MNQLQVLYQLQELESALDAAKSRITEIEAELENNTGVARARAKLENHEQALREAETVARDLELEIKGLEEKRAEAEKILYDGSVKNPKLLQERQKEVESLKRRQADLETSHAEANTAVDQARAAHREAEEGLEEALIQQESDNVELTQEREKLHQQMSRWLKKRKTTKAQLDDGTYKIYKKIKTMKNGVAVARLNGDTCAVCRVEQNQTIVHQVKHDKAMIQCNNCGRILVEV